MQYDYLIVGAGLFGCVCANQLKKKGYKILILDKNPFIGGTCYTRNDNGINVNVFGAHIFRTNDKWVFDYMKQFAEFNHYVNSPIGIVNGKAYNLPFNMNTFAKVFNITTPQEAKEIIEKEKKIYKIKDPKNLEEHAISLVGKTIYEMFIKNYTEKQWGKPCKELPASIMRRIPVRFRYDNNYYDCKYQGMPIGGYTPIFEKMLDGCDVILNEDFNKNRDKYLKLAEKIIYTGPIDELFDFKFGYLEYRGLKFVEKKYPVSNYQGNAVLNYCDKEPKYTRSIEHKHFEFIEDGDTIVSYEYPSEWKPGDYPFYSINDDKNESLYNKYLKEIKNYPNLYLGGRLGSYKYFDMQDTIKEAFNLIEKLV